MHGDIGSVCISEKEALEIKKEFEEIFNYCKIIFDNSTKYENVVIDILRADGLTDDEITKCLREL